MNSQNENTAARLRQIDRLAAGDLAEPQRRELLAWLDAQPARWRQCGLAFLEAQAWGEAFAGERPLALPDTQSHHTTAQKPAVELTCRPAMRQPSARLQAVLAAALLFAFSLGFITRHTWSAGDGKLPVGGGNEQRVPVARGALAKDGAGNVGRRNVEPGRPATHPVPAADAATAHYGNINDAIAGHLVLTQSPGEQAAIALPVRERLPDGPRQSPLPDYVRQQLERQGFRLDQRRGAMRMELTDGRWLEVPVDRVEVRYQGKHVY